MPAISEFLRRMKICFVTHLYYPDGGGDVFGHHAMARALIDRGNRVGVVTWARHRKQGQRQVIDGVEVARLRGANLRPLPSIRDYPLLFGIGPAISSASADVVNCHSHLFPSTLQGITAAKSQGIPTVVTVHGVSAFRDSLTNLAQKAYLLSVGRLFLGKVDCVVCLTNHDKRTMRHFGLRCRIEVIANGVDLKLFRPAKTREIRTVTWTGRMVPEKGLQHLLAAASIVAKEVPDIRLNLAGDGPEMPRLKRLAKSLGLETNCYFMGPKSQEEVASILSLSSVFVLPSLSEGMPRSMLEAMASGNAIVASDIPQTRAVIADGRTGLLCDPANHSLFAEKLRDCLENVDLARELGAASRKVCEERFDLKNTALEYDRLYRRLAERPPENSSIAFRPN